jgi:hypothetical protein
MPDFAPKWQRSGESAHKRWTERWTAVHRPPGRTNSPSHIRWRCISGAPSQRLQSYPSPAAEFESTSCVLREPLGERRGARVQETAIGNTNSARILTPARLGLSLPRSTFTRQQSSSRRCTATPGNLLNRPTMSPDAKAGRPDLGTAIRRGTVLRNCLRPVGPAWIKSAILERSHPAYISSEGLNLKTIAGQQETGTGQSQTHGQRRSAERKEESSKLYADFTAVLHKQGSSRGTIWA